MPEHLGGRRRILAALGTTCQHILGTAHSGGQTAVWFNDFSCADTPGSDNSNCAFLTPSPNNPTLAPPLFLNQHKWIQGRCNSEGCGCTDPFAGFAPAQDNQIQHDLLGYSEDHRYEDGSCDYQALCGVAANSPRMLSVLTDTNAGAACSCRRLELYLETELRRWFMHNGRLPFNDPTGNCARQQCDALSTKPEKLCPSPYQVYEFAAEQSR